MSTITTVLYLFLRFWLCHTACGILVPCPGIEPMLPELEAWSLNHWTTREVPSSYILYIVLIFYSVSDCSTSWSLEHNIKFSVNSHFFVTPNLIELHLWESWRTVLGMLSSRHCLHLFPLGVGTTFTSFKSSSLVLKSWVELPSYPLTQTEIGIYLHRSPSFQAHLMVCTCPVD